MSRPICGIAGFCLSPEEVDPLGRRINSRRLAQALLLGIEERGPHATGAAWRCDLTGHVTQKRDVTASRFVKGLSMPRRAQAAILHTRYWTKGVPSNPLNNHPIQVANIVGVHNGGVWNDDELFTDMGITKRRIAQVDSEAIFATLAYGMERYENTESRRVPQADTITDLLEVIEGGAAVAWLNNEEPDDVMHVARLSSSPLVWGQTKLGSFVFASTVEALYEGADAARMEIVHGEYLEEGTYLRIKAGRITDQTMFKPASSDFASSFGKWRSKNTYSITRNGNRQTAGVEYKTSYSMDDLQEYEDWWQKNADAVNGDSADNVLELPATSAIEDVGGGKWVSTATGGYRPLTQEEKDEEDLVEQAGAVMAAQEETTGEAELTEPFIPGRYLNLTSPRPTMGETEYGYHYGAREAAAVKWFAELKTPTQLALSKLRRDFHYWVRPGDWVHTKFMGSDVFAQVVNMPETFPHGVYCLRAILRNEDRGAGFECVYITRHGHEFETSSSTRVKVRAKEAEANNEEVKQSV